MNAILGFLKSFLAKGSSLFGLKSVIDSFFGKEPANKIVKSDYMHDSSMKACGICRLIATKMLIDTGLSEPLWHKEDARTKLSEGFLIMQ